MAVADVVWGAIKEFVPGKKGVVGGYQLSCRLLKMHVLDA